MKKISSSFFTFFIILLLAAGCKKDDQLPENKVQRQRNPYYQASKTGSGISIKLLHIRVRQNKKDPQQ
jgi:hypothetical protein